MTREQFIANVEATQRSLRRFLVALCGGDAAMADDIAQESLIKAYLSVDGIRDTDKFKSWIFRIAYNTFVSCKRSVVPTESEDTALHLPSASGADDAFKYQALYDALDALSEKERTACLLHYLEGYSVDEISDIVASSPMAVKQQLSRGRLHLRQLLSARSSNSINNAEYE